MSKRALSLWNRWRSMSSMAMAEAEASIRFFCLSMIR